MLNAEGEALKVVYFPKQEPVEFSPSVWLDTDETENGFNIKPGEIAEFMQALGRIMEKVKGA